MNEDFEGILHFAIRVGMDDKLECEDDEKTLFRIMKYYMPFLSERELRLIMDDIKWKNLTGQWDGINISCLHYIGVHTVIPDLSCSNYDYGLDFVSYYSMKYAIYTPPVLDWVCNWIIEHLNKLSLECIDKLINMINSNNDYYCDFDRKELKKIEDLLLDCRKGKSTVH